MRRIFHSAISALTIFAAAILTACSNTDYVNSIPAQSTALLSVDASKLSGLNSTLVLKTLLKTTDLGKSGVDLSQKIYLFETQEGNIGVCAAVHDADLLEQTLSKADGGGVEQKRGYSFSLVGSWLAGYSDNTLLVMGPVNQVDKAVAINQMAKYLSQDDSQGITNKPLFQALDTISSAMAIVAQAGALPQQLVMPVMLGAPKDADPSQVVLSAAITMNNGMMIIDGRTFSWNKQVDKALQSAYTTYRPIKGRYLSAMAADAACGMFVNVDGTKFIDIMRSNRGLQAMLAGINAAIDMDNIIKSVDGEMAVITPSYSEGHLSMSMTAELAHSKWLADVDYWKQSVPQGGHLIDWKPNAYRYTDGKTSFCFGVSADKQFYSGSTPEEAEQSIEPSAAAISPVVADAIRGSKFALYANISALTSGGTSAVAAMLRPVFGNVEGIVYVVK